MISLQEMGKRSKEASKHLSQAGIKRTAVLQTAAGLLRKRQEEILAANRIDLEQAQANGMSPSLQDRLLLNESRIESMAKAVEEVAAAPDPVGKLLSGETLPNGLRIEKITVPLGVVGMIYEARPNVTCDAAALCLKSGNTVILRGGKEALSSNRSLANVFREALVSQDLSADCVQLTEDPSRQSAADLMNLTEFLDVLIPRGGAGLIRSVRENAHVPVVETGVGNCHAYVDRTADPAMAAEIVFNGKTSRPSVCNALETLLIHRDAAPTVLPRIAGRLREKQVELRGCPETCALLPEAVPASEEDWETEYLDYILAVKVVGSLDEALAHIARYSTGHSECIVTEDYSAAERFLREVDSAAVYVNASTRFTDGGEFGLGAEIGISTQKLHIRGPMGLAGLVSTKYLIRGNGQVR